MPGNLIEIFIIIITALVNYGHHMFWRLTELLNLLGHHNFVHE